MPETFAERLVALVGFTAVLVLVGVSLVGEENGGRPDATPPPPVENPEPAANPPPARTTPARPSPQATPPPTATKTEPTPRPPGATRLNVSASRGSCWVSIRLDSAEGESLYEGLLEEGGTIRQSGRRLWIRLGAAANVDLTLNGRPVERLPAGTIDLIATPGRVQAAS